MKIYNIVQNLWLPLVMLALYLVTINCRPLLPVDETRYMSVAWEMFLRQGWFQPLTVNFEPYHHKPPFLFWLINLSWSVFGISRWAGLVPVILASLSCVYLTSLLGKCIFPKDHSHQRTYLMMIGCFPFMIYGTLIMFDFMLCAFVLLSLIWLHYFRHTGRWHYVLLAGLSLGLGVLTKGPVAYLYVIPVMMFAPLWAKDFSNAKQWYGGITSAIFISVMIVLLWLIPVLKASDSNFAIWLVWNQTAGRVTGNFNASHVRPVWFYFPLVPLFFMPWIFFSTFWKGLSSIKQEFKMHEGLRFLSFWLIPVFVAFSLISGKQPHYLVPLVPGIILFVAYRLQNIQTKFLARVSAVVLICFVGGELTAGQTIFKKYSLQPVAEIVQTQPDRDLAFVNNYQGEMGFMSRRETAVDDVQLNELDAWFNKHPQGWAIIRFKHGSPDIQKYKMVFSSPYRGQNLGLFEK